jgi:hypothetical protein
MRTAMSLTELSDTKSVILGALDCGRLTADELARRQTEKVGCVQTDESLTRRIHHAEREIAWEIIMTHGREWI